VRVRLFHLLTNIELPIQSQEYEIESLQLFVRPVSANCVFVEPIVEIEGRFVSGTCYLETKSPIFFTKENYSCSIGKIHLDALHFSYFILW